MKVRLEELFASAPLYAILDTGVQFGQLWLGVLDVLIEAGVRVVQYRHKEFFDRRHYDECSLLARRAAERGACFFVNDRADIAVLSGARGVHLGQDDLPPKKARVVVGDDFYIGYSTHTLEQAARALREPIDYLAIGPIFPTATKHNPDPVVGLEMVRQLRAMMGKSQTQRIPLIAIGGITLRNARAVMEAGADAVAVIRDLFDAPDIGARAKEFLKELKAAKA
jgi:thiamine-phosphate pyrophosphorylase